MCESTLGSNKTVFCFTKPAGCRTVVDQKSFRVGNFFHIYDRGILEIVAAVKGEDVDKLCDTIYENTIKLFF